MRGLVVVLALMAWAGLAGSAAAAEISGDMDTYGPLIIDPATSPVTGEDSRNAESGVFIQRMPVTKTITGVTLGDYAKPSFCTADMTAYVNVYHASDGRLRTLGEPFGFSTGPATVTSTAGRLHWTLQSPYTLLAGHAYQFRLTFYGCPTVLRMTWQHHPDGSQVEGGPQPCQEMSYGLPVSVGHLAGRMWHSYLSEDAQPACANNVGANDWDASFPQGWLVTVSYNGTDSYVRTVEHRTGPPIPGSICGDNHLEGHDVTEVFWKTSPHDPLNSIYVCQWTQYEPFGTQTQAGWQYAFPFKDGAEPRSSYLRLDTIDYDALLRKYSPTLFYDSQEQYYAMAADSAVANIAGPGCEDEAGFAMTNYLRRGSDHSVLAAADPGCGPLLSMDWLVPDGAGYPGTSGTNASSADFLDEAPNYGPDSARIYLLSGYADRIHGRAVQDSDGTLWLQYWIWYYYNDGQVPLNNFDHEGDWENVQIKLTGSPLTPVSATYAQHEKAETCLWWAVEKFTGDHPNVFVASGRHGSYFHPGEFLQPDFNPIWPDEADGLGPHVTPSVETITARNPVWVRWPGLWGASGEGGGLPQSSPRGPAGHDQWSDPGALEEKDVGCRPIDEMGAKSSSAGEATARAVDLDAERVDGTIRVAYRVPEGSGRRLLRVTINSQARRLPPSAQQLTLSSSRRSGALRLKLPLGPGPYVVRGSVFTPDGRGPIREVVMR